MIDAGTLLLAILAVTLVFGLGFMVIGDIGGYRVEEFVVPYSDPPIRRFRVMGRWPRNLITYHVFRTKAEADAWVTIAEGLKL